MERSLEGRFLEDGKRERERERQRTTKERRPPGGFQLRLWVLYRLHGNPSRCLIKLSPCPPPRHSILPSLRCSPPLRCSFYALPPLPKRPKDLTGTKPWSLPETFLTTYGITHGFVLCSIVYHLYTPLRSNAEGRYETFNSLFRRMKNSKAS